MNAEAKLAPIRESIVVDAPLEKTWRIMTSPQTVPRWLGCLQYQGAVGSLFYMQQDQAKAQAGDIAGATHCEILALDAPIHFRFSWFVPGFPATFISLRWKRCRRRRHRSRSHMKAGISFRRTWCARFMTRSRGAGGRSCCRA